MTTKINIEAKAESPWPETRMKKINISGMSLEMELVNNLDDYLDELTEEANKDEDLIPYWSELWPSSYAMAEFILQDISQFKSRSIIEIGCGVGLISTVLMKAGIEVLATDFQKTALKFTENNVYRNSGRHIDTYLLDWRYPDIDKKFDIIIASDVVYESRAIKPVVNVFNHLLEKNGEIFLAEPNRTIAQPFFALLRSRGFVFEKTAKIIDYEGRKKDISIYHIK